MTEKQKEMYETLTGLTGEAVTNLFIDWLGVQVLSKDFAEFLQREGYLPESEDDGAE